MCEEKDPTDLKYWDDLRRKGDMPFL
jgi:hypothetical protein